MKEIKLKMYIEDILKKSDKFADKDGKIFIYKVIEAVENIDIDLVQLLLKDERTKKYFFTTTKDFCILNQNKLIELFSMNEYQSNSFTSYKNKIGLIKKDSFIKKYDDVVLAFPYKDCVLEGGQTKDDDKNNEVFYNNVLSADEIDRLFEPKVLTNIKKFDKEGEHRVDEITENDNLIIKGNNLLALHSLKERYRGKVKLIYIDPPYNTGNDSFNYNDNFNHSTWLTFMKNRLEVAKEFLSDDGVIYLSLDDKEIHYLKVLMDEIFGRNNFVGNIAWESKTKSQNTKDSFNKLQPKVEHILLYTKNSKRRFNLLKKGEKEYLKKDEIGKYREYQLEVMNAEGVRGRSSMVFEIDGILPPKDKQWKIGQETILEYKNRNDLFIKDNKIILKIRPENETSEITEPFWGLLKKDIGTAETAKKELSEILNTNKHGFETVKPTKLLKRLIFHVVSKNDIVMDFFAESILSS